MRRHAGASGIGALGENVRGCWVLNRCCRRREYARKGSREVPSARDAYQPATCTATYLAAEAIAGALPSKQQAGHATGACDSGNGGGMWRMPPRPLNCVRFRRIHEKTRSGPPNRPRTTSSRDLPARPGQRAARIRPVDADVHASTADDNGQDRERHRSYADSPALQQKTPLRSIVAPKRITVLYQCLRISQIGGFCCFPCSGAR